MGREGTRVGEGGRERQVAVICFSLFGMKPAKSPQSGVATISVHTLTPHQAEATERVSVVSFVVFSTRKVVEEWGKMWRAENNWNCSVKLQRSKSTGLMSKTSSQNDNN